MKVEGILTPPKGKNKYWGVTIPLIGIHTQGKSKKDAYAMAVDAIESLVNKGGFSVSCQTTGEYSFLIGSEDTPTFTAFVLARLRSASNLTARAVAKVMKSNSPNAYARYEKGKVVPKLDTLEELLKAINPKISVVLKAG